MRFLLVAQLAISCASATLSSADQKEILDATHDNRRLSVLENHLAPYNGEAPISAGLVGSTMLLGIFSTNGPAYKHELYSNRRKYIRETYLAIDDDRICKLEEFKRQLGMNPQLRRCKIPYTFVIGAGGSDRPYDHNDDEPLTLNADQVDDADDEGDCTYLNIRQNMEEGKSTTYAKFGTTLPVDYIAKVDDDTVLAIQLLLQLMEDDLPPIPYNKRIYGGSSWASRAHSHLYATGPFYFMSADLANYVSRQLTIDKRVNLMHSRHTEDADMASFIFSHSRPIKFINLRTYLFWHHPKKLEEEFLEAWGNIEGFPNGIPLFPYNALCPLWLKGRGL